MLLAERMTCHLARDISISIDNSRRSVFGATSCTQLSS